MSEIRVTTISDTAGTGAVTLTKQSAAKVWVNFNGTGTVAINNSFNASSITDNGTGHYDVNYSSAMGNTTYCVQNHDISYGNGWAESLTTTSYDTRRRNESGGYMDVSAIWGLVHGDLA